MNLSASNLTLNDAIINYSLSKVSFKTKVDTRMPRKMGSEPLAASAKVAQCSVTRILSSYNSSSEHSARARDWWWTWLEEITMMTTISHDCNHIVRMKIQMNHLEVRVTEWTGSYALGDEFGTNISRVSQVSRPTGTSYFLSFESAKGQGHGSHGNAGESALLYVIRCYFHPKYPRHSKEIDFLVSSRELLVTSKW